MFDTIIKNGTILDGSGRKKFSADIGLSKGKIKGIGTFSSAKAVNEIDAKGMMVTPGFVDIHSPSDVYWTLFKYPTQDSLIRQGVTTIIGGNCGSSLAPLFDEEAIKSIQKWTNIDEVHVDWHTLEEFLQVLEKSGLALNYGTLVGHSTIRRGLIHDQTRDLNEDELRVLQRAVKESMSQGAFGLSLGLEYSHSRYVKTAELIALAKEMTRFNGVLAVHLRDEGRGIEPAVTEALDVAKYSGANLEISHFKFRGPDGWDFVQSTLDIMEKRAKEGLNVNFDIYPYQHTASVLYAYLPDWVSEGGNAKLITRLKDKSLRSKIVDDIRKDPYHFGELRIAQTPYFSQSIGKKLKEIAADQETSVEEAMINVLIANQGKVIVFDKTRKAEYVDKLVEHPLSLISSDGFGLRYETEEQNNLVHPRAFGTFPRVLSRYVLQEKKLTWEEAIAKSSGKPAEKYGIEGRGLLREGFAADVVVLDPKKIADLATFKNPFQYASGVRYVLVNGQLVVADGLTTGNLPGSVLRKS